MALVVEDGTIVAGATSYVTLAEARAYALARGLTLPADDPTLEVSLIQAIDYLESYRSSYQGVLVSPGVQELQWPRAGCFIDGYELPANVIPKLLKDAQSRLAYEVSSGVDLNPTVTGRLVLSEKIGDIAVTYSGTDKTEQAPSMPNVDNLLAPLLRKSVGIALTSIRV